MRNIEVKVLNPSAIKEAEQMMVCAARLTQRGQNIQNMDDFMNLYYSDYMQKTVDNMVHLPHPTIQKFGTINIAIVGASRRFLAQITRHQNEVKFMSASLQYSNYSGAANFTIPYEVMENNCEAQYLAGCELAMKNYEGMCAMVGHDAAGFMMPQGLRNVLIISATPYQWKHMIGQRICRRNSTETRYVMLRCWEALAAINPLMFCGDTTGPFCMQGGCKEGGMACGKYMHGTPSEIIAHDFPLLEEQHED